MNSKGQRDYMLSHVHFHLPFFPSLVLEEEFSDRVQARPKVWLCCGKRGG